MTSQSHLAAYYRQLATLLASGVAMLRALETLERSAPGRRLRAVSAALGERIRAGGDLSDGLAAHATVFPALHRELIRVGERSGTVDRQLNHLAAHLEQLAAVRREIRGQLAYPLLTLHLAIILVPLPPLLLAQGVGGYLRVVIGALAAFYAGAASVWFLARQLARSRPVSVAADRFVLALPAIGKIHRDLALTRFFAALRALLDAGVVILEALPRAGAACGSAALAKASRDAAPRLQRGESLATVWANVLPPTAASMIATGQESGKLDDMLAHLEQYFLDESRRRFRALANWLPKLIYAAVVLWVGWMILQAGFGYLGILRQGLGG
ncbi:MAG: type II secretion system F family protein [Verrucomicrobiae bacterium]|nr:type II secretion system F family protein [Verrucomicrobiae bacterium]